MQSSPTSSEPEVVGPYELLSRLAVGELGAIYAARLQGASAVAERVALKLLHLGQTHDPERRDALRREAAISAMATPHGRVLAYVDEVRPYLVMELVEGASLSQLLTRSRARGVDGIRYATTILIQTLRELQSYHDGTWSALGAPLLHQAPSARHILVGSDGSARLTDFTMALCPSLPRRALGEQRLRPTEMAPEQALAPAYVGAGCDLFIVGISLWEAVTGKPLFAASSVQTAMDKMLRESIPPPSEVGAPCHRSLDRVCQRALSRARIERYPSAAEMAAELRFEAQRAGLLAEQHEIAAWVTSTLGSAGPALEPSGHASSVHAQVAVAGEVSSECVQPDQRERSGGAEARVASSDAVATYTAWHESREAGACGADEALAPRPATERVLDHVLASARTQLNQERVRPSRGAQWTPARVPERLFASSGHARSRARAKNAAPVRRRLRYALPLAVAAAVGLLLRFASFGEAKSQPRVHAQSPAALGLLDAAPAAHDRRPPARAAAPRNVLGRRDDEPAPARRAGLAPAPSSALRAQVAATPAEPPPPAPSSDLSLEVPHVAPASKRAPGSSRVAAKPSAGSQTQSSGYPGGWYAAPATERAVPAAPASVSAIPANPY